MSGGVLVTPSIENVLRDRAYRAGLAGRPDRREEVLAEHGPKVAGAWAVGYRRGKERREVVRPDTH